MVSKLLAVTIELYTLVRYFSKDIYFKIPIQRHIKYCSIRITYERPIISNGLNYLFFLHRYLTGVIKENCECNKSYN